MRRAFFDQYVAALAAALAAALVAIASLPVTAAVAGAGELPPGGTFYDDDRNTHEGYIEAVAAAGITAGCDEFGTFYCPSQPVTRAQMATFLARSLGITFTGYPDAFDDDEGSVHEPWINAMAALGVTSGCDASSPRRYCPEDSVSRAQMATFLVRAFDHLQPSSADAFSDDDGSVHETNIDGIALAGVTQGCSTVDPSLYCPGQAVRRDQMATFLGRALGLTPMVPPPRPGFICTEVIGFSQTNEWYSPNGGAFESAVDNSAWQLRWQSGAGVDLIAGAGWGGWASEPRSPCSVQFVDRVVLTISGGAGSDVARWASDITDAVAQIRSQHPAVREIWLQAVVGGPGEALCFWNGQQIRASYQHPYIDQAIGQVASADPGVVAGYSPEVPTCAAYRDNLGHLDSAYHDVVGADIGSYYAAIG